MFLDDLCCATFTIALQIWLAGQARLEALSSEE